MLSSPRDPVCVQRCNAPMCAAVCLPTPAVCDSCHLPVDSEPLCAIVFLLPRESTPGDASRGTDGVNATCARDRDRLLTSLHQDHTQPLRPAGWVQGTRGVLAAALGQVSTFQEAFAGAEPQ